ncbi:MAG: hypothetical protein HRT35_29710 [Algicola sp.]|nr:hypothetical protein [Algicola sp.]
MKVILKRDFDTVYDFLKMRVEAFDIDRNISGQSASGFVHLITLGFQLDSPSWFCLHLDTREGAVPDGQWTKYIEGNDCPLEQWSVALEQEDVIEVKLPDGGEFQIEDELTTMHIAQVGELFKSVLLKARAEGVLEALPLAQNCTMVIEEINGHYGWPKYENLLTEGIVQCSFYQ